MEAEANGASHPGKKGPRTISRRACDACRIRKIKCEPLEDSLSSPSASPFAQDGSRKRSREANSLPCKACAAIPLDCTHNMPVKRRGPPNRLAQQAKIVVTPEPSHAVFGESRTVSERSVGASSDQLSSESTSAGHVQHLSISSPGMDNHFRPPNSRSSPFIQSPGFSGPGSLPFSIPSRLPSFDDGVFKTDLVCSNDLFDIIMTDYMDILHPINPFVHLPTFRADLARRRQDYDQVFFALTVAFCAYVVGALPRKFHEYHIYDSTFRFRTRKEMVDYCLKLIQLSRPIGHLDELSIEKWAIAVLCGISCNHTNMDNRGWAFIGEAMLISEMLKIHRISSYRGLDCIETQLRKKAFWVGYYAMVHHHIGERNWPSLADRLYYQNADTEHLMPVEVDDEYITRTEVMPQPPFKTSIVTAFNAVSRIFACLMPAYKDCGIPIVRTMALYDETSEVLGKCSCGNGIRAPSQREFIISILDRVRYILDYLPPEFGPWHSETPEAPEIRDGKTFAQYEAMRANIHVTHLYAQSVLTEKLIAVSSLDRMSDADAKMVWSLREDLCRQLLQLLYNIRQSSLEPNGSILTMKIREVASTLLDCPFEDQSHIAKRAASYISKFVDLLARLDGNTEPSMETQLWNNLDSQPRAFPSSFIG